MNTNKIRYQAIDFFRGCGLLMIFINHIPNNSWSWFMPTWLGFTDAADLFVFCSGLVVAIAYGRYYENKGYWQGVLKTSSRCFQLYIVHLSVILIYFALTVLAQFLTGIDYPTGAHMDYFYREPFDAIKYLLELKYIPNYLGILPMYIIMLGILPVIIAVSRIHRFLVLIISPAIYSAMYLWDLHFIGDPEAGWPWFFNPFGWQLLFFLAYAIGSGWIPYPKESKPLLIACIVFCLIAAPLSHDLLHEYVPFLAEWRKLIQPALHKTPCAPLRIIYALAAAYILRWWSVKHSDFFNQRFARWLTITGQFSLPVFATSSLLSFIAFVIMEKIQYAVIPTLIINIICCLLLIGLAHILHKRKQAANYYNPTPIDTARQTTV